MLNKEAQAAVLSVVPKQGPIGVGDTFTAQILIDTEGASVNAVDVRVSFPPDKLQVTSPSSGNSIIEIYTTPPKYNNQTGTIQIAGGIPGGISAKAGLIATITFRAKSPGTAIIRFGDGSKTLLNDGQGTDALSNTRSASVELQLPPPAGPRVYSDTHPSSDVWYRNKNAVIKWDAEEGIEGYSYMLSDQPTDTPDDVSEGTDNSITYRTLADGVHYFHIKALREGRWGGSTHFAFKIDSTGPAEFPIEIVPRARTTVRQPIINFSTTDNLSGLARYELKIVPLKEGQPSEEEALFIEANSPYSPAALEIGSYEVIVRAYDNADNFRESSQRLEITDIDTWLIGRTGFEIPNLITISWGALSLILLLLIIILIWILRKVRKWHHAYKKDLAEQNLPDHIKQQLTELKEYQSKYGKLAALFAILIGSTFIFANTGLIQAEEVKLLPATITTYSEETTDEELFFVSGRTDDPETEVLINVQNTLLNDTYSYTVTSDRRSDWSFRSQSPLRYGTYAIWVQSKIGDELSPPSPQVTMKVHKVAFNLSGSRITYLTAYIVAIGILAGIILLLVLYIIYHALQGRRKRKEFIGNLKLAEESIKRGFAMLRRDIQAELALVKQATLSPEISAEERVREEQLLADLKYVEDYVGKEIWDTEHFEGLPDKRE